jgi:G:T-mismatch repair DNA endonuclease (very short patch repair protein)
MKRHAGHLAAVRERGWRGVVVWDCETANAEMLEARLSALFPPGGEPASPEGRRTRAPAAARSA